MGLPPPAPTPRPQLPPRLIMFDPSGSMGPWEDALKEVLVQALSEQTRRSVALFFPGREPIQLMKADGALLEDVAKTKNLLPFSGAPKPVQFQRLLASRVYRDWVASLPVGAGMDYLYVTDDESAFQDIVHWPKPADWTPGATATVVFLDEDSLARAVGRSDPSLALIHNGGVRTVGRSEFLRESRAWSLEERLQALPDPKEDRVRLRM